MERTLAKSTISIMHFFDDGQLHTYGELLAHFGNPLKVDMLLRALLSMDMLTVERKGLDYSRMSLSYDDLLGISMRGILQLELEEEEISRRGEDIKYTERQLAEAKEQATVANLKARNANIIAIIAIAVSIICTALPLILGKVIQLLQQL